MAWTTPRTWASEVLTSTLFNTHVRDNLNETAPAKVTTKGDLVVATAANTIARLAVGTNGEILVSDSAAAGGVRWSGTGKTAAAGIALGVAPQYSLTAGANSDTLYGVYHSGTFASGTYTGLIAANTVAFGSAMTKTGTGTIASAYALLLDEPTIGTTNYSLYVSSGDSYLGNNASKVFLNATANTKQTNGLTLKMGTTADEVISVKHPDVAHGMTGLSETDTFFSIGNHLQLLGGVKLTGYSEDLVAMHVIGCATAGSTDKNVGADANIVLDARLKSGTSFTTHGANENLLAIRSGGQTKFIFDAEGDSHEDGTGWTAYDDYDDAALCEAVDLVLDKRLREETGAWLAEKRELLEKAGIVTFNEGGAPFINKSRLGMLLVGAARQNAREVNELREQVGKLTAALQALPGPSGA